MVCATSTAMKAAWRARRRSLHRSSASSVGVQVPHDHRPQQSPLRSGPGHLQRVRTRGPMSTPMMHFRPLMQRQLGFKAVSVGEAIISQAGAQAWNQATQMLWKTKATLAGDLLGDVWSKVAWVNPEDRRDRRLSWPRSHLPSHADDPAQLVGAMANCCDRPRAQRGLGHSRGGLDHRHRGRASGGRSRGFSRAAQGRRFVAR
jgi:hypothetical protein